MHHILSNYRKFSTNISKLFFPRIAVVGSGPSGLYVCAKILQRLSRCTIDVFEKNQAPYGLVTFGVAPDHYDMKKCSNYFERIFTENRGKLSLYCNVSLSNDISFDELCTLYDVVVLAYGANRPRSLGLENERAINCFSGRDFVFWYNGLPHHSGQIPLLDSSKAIIIGNGNVAIDCARILVSSMEKLSQTDVPESAMRVLRSSKVNDVKILGRRGPMESSFTIKELRELLTMDDCRTYCDLSNEVKDHMMKELNQMERPRKRLAELILKHTSLPKLPGVEKKLTLEFYWRTEKILVDNTGRVQSLQLINHLNERIEVPCRLLIYAIGFENVLLDGLPRTENNRLLMSDWCRVPNTKSNVYATGWCSHNARGIIADSQDQAYLVADQLVADLENNTIKVKGANGARELLEKRNVPFISWEDWEYIDGCEKRMGALLGKPREKILELPYFFRIKK